MRPSKNNNFFTDDTLQDNSSDDEEKHKKRRSKKETVGRNYNCKLCNKSYLSYPALYSHCRQKHNRTCVFERGRSKKDTSGLNSEEIEYNLTDISYFKQKERKGIVTEYVKPITDAFEEIYINSANILDKKGMAFCETIKEHSFLGRYLNSQHVLNENIENKKECCDKVFIKYLNDISVHINPTFFSRLIVFVTLFREYINQNCKDQLNSEFEFSSLNSAENVPNLSNNFLNFFLQIDSNDFYFSKEEAIELNQNFCNWLFENDFTSSKLSLIDNDK